MKKQLVVTIASLSTVAGLLVGGMYMGSSAAEFDLPQVTQQLQNHDERLDNHEARIKNVESDVEDVQNNTDTQPSVQRVEVPVVATEEVKETEKEQTPPKEEEDKVTTVSATPSQETQGDKVIYYCNVKYSDGSTKMIKVGESTPDIDLGNNCEGH